MTGKHLYVRLRIKCILRYLVSVVLRNTLRDILVDQRSPAVPGPVLVEMESTTIDVTPAWEWLAASTAAVNSAGMVPR
jgi:hypothetical protein